MLSPFDCFLAPRHRLIFFCLFSFCLLTSCTASHATKKSTEKKTSNSTTRSSSKKNSATNSLEKPEEFVPDNFSLFDKIHGDLNKDGKDDCVLIVKSKDKSQIVFDESNEPIDRNRRNYRFVQY